MLCFALIMMFNINNLTRNPSSEGQNIRMDDFIKRLEMLKLTIMINS